MQSFKFLPDIAIADIAFEAYGTTLDELFQHAAEAMFTGMVDLATVTPTITKEIHVHGNTLEEALYNFLEELVYLKDVEVMVFSQFTVRVSPGKVYRVHAIIKGEEINQKKHKLGNDVKAVTLHQFSVKKEKGLFIARVVIDV